MQRLDLREFGQQVVHRRFHARRDQRAVRVLQRHRALARVVPARKQDLQPARLQVPPCVMDAGLGNAEVRHGCIDSGLRIGHDQRRRLGHELLDGAIARGLAERPARGGPGEEPHRNQPVLLELVGTGGNAMPL